MQLARRLTHALILVLTLMIGATAAAVIVSQTAWFKNWVRAYIVREAGLYLNGTLTIERLSGNVLFGLEMENIDVSMDGSTWWRSRTWVSITTSGTSSPKGSRSTTSAWTSRDLPATAG
jgi:hypothetical protein